MQAEKADNAKQSVKNCNIVNKVLQATQVVVLLVSRIAIALTDPT